MTPDADGQNGRRRRDPRRRTAGGAKPSGDAEPSGDGRARRARGRRPRLRPGEAIALVAAILLFVLMFFDWYGAKATTGAETLGGVVSGTGGGSAWDTLEVIPLFLMLAIVVTVGAAILRLSGSDWKPAIPPAAAVCVLGILASVLILVRIISPPGPGGALSELAFESTLRLPIFLALAAALGIAYGGWREMGEEGTSFAAIGKRLESPAPPARRGR
ncbi:MAG: hypothetical protein JST08_09080 [Actinobacteria bacterium]|nr:hypothetical protein [Actinomycetota bacterium]